MIGVVHGTGKLFFMTFCSDVQVEPLPGTAKKESVFVLFEWPNGWSRDILDGGTFGPELTAQLKVKLKGVAGLQLIRKPGKEGRVINGQHRCYVVWAEQGVCKEYLLDGPADILGLDLGAPLGDVAKHPLVLICTHGRRDVCCAVKGRPLAAELAAEFPDVVWETSHTKGHRFAPSILLMPWGYSFGRLNLEAARDRVCAAQRGEYFYPGDPEYSLERDKNGDGVGLTRADGFTHLTSHEFLEGFREMLDGMCVQLGHQARGVESANFRWTNSVAILAGDVLLAHAFCFRLPCSLFRGQSK